MVNVAELIELGTISSRGQVAIPADIRKVMDLREGVKIMFVVSDDTLLIKKVSQKTFAEITKPLKEAMRKTTLKEEDVSSLVHALRTKKRA